MVHVLRDVLRVLFIPESKSQGERNMATTDHNGSYSVGTIVGYKSYSGTVYGYKLVKEVYLSETGKYHWIVQPGKVQGNAFVLNSGSEMTIISEKEINDSYTQTWTADAEYAKGDILVGKDKKTGKVMLFVFLSKQHVERLTPRSDMIADTQFGYSTLTDYESNFGPLEIHKTKGYTAVGNNSKFSAL